MGYRSICNTRKDCKAGGVAILIKNELVEGAEFIKNTANSDYLVCKLDKTFFNLTRDIFLVNIYIKPHNSSASSDQNNGKDSFKNIENIINELRGEGEVILCGDFNARIADKPAMLKHDTNEFIPLPDDYSPDEYRPRNSQDLGINPYGSYFNDVILNNQLTILNGRTLGDFTGKFTSIQKQGCSVIDYFAVSAPLNSRVNHLKVLNFTEFSDHRPLSMELQCIDRLTVNQHSPIEECYDPAPCRFIFSEDNKDRFLKHRLTITR